LSFENATPFVGSPRLRDLLKVDLAGRVFFLYGFETKQVVCLRVAVRSLEGSARRPRASRAPTSAARATSCFR
jgi:hypothetical protein